MKAAPAKRSAGRPPKLGDGEKITVNTAKASSKLQAGSERRAIVNAVIDAGGSTTLAALNDKFGFDMRQAVLSLMAAGWLTTEESK